MLSGSGRHLIRVVKGVEEPWRQRERQTQDRRVPERRGARGVFGEHRDIWRIPGGGWQAGGEEAEGTGFLHMNQDPPGMSGIPFR